LEILKRNVSAKVMLFGKDKGDVRCEYLGGTLGGSRVKLIFPSGEEITFEMPLSGAHQAMNAAAAATAAFAAGITPAVIAAGLAKTVLPGGRSRIYTSKGVTCVDDTYNANPAAVTAALHNLKEFAEPEKLILLLGEMRELGDFSAGEHAAILDEALQLFPQCRIVTIGQYPQRDNVRNFAVSVEAAEYLAGIVRQGDIVFAKGSRGIAVEKALPPEAQ
jgi:UDP-N-acetylmuramoyl-tripeptide--D-alanyl-D-alanine ligase